MSLLGNRIAIAARIGRLLVAECQREPKCHIFRALLVLLSRRADECFCSRMTLELLESWTCPSQPFLN